MRVAFKVSTFLAVIGWLLASTGRLRAADYEFELRYDAKLGNQPYTGRVYLFFSRHSFTEPRNGPDWFHPEPFVALDVRDWKGNTPLRIGKSSGDRLLAFPQGYAKVDLSNHRVQAVARFNPWERQIGKGAGNICSQPLELPAAAGTRPISLMLNQRIPERLFVENQWSRLLKVRSQLLSDFHRREVFLQACVAPPASYYQQPRRRYPVILTVPGFSGRHFAGMRTTPTAEQNPGGVEFFRVMLDPSCPLGHHVFADSANNGPVGEALVKEFLPELDRQYRTVAAPTARFLTGHSSGGWSTLWLQVTYPETFGGTWSTSPDPVDFRDFQKIDLYAPGINMYRDESGTRRPICRPTGGVQLWYDDFDLMETVLGYGGQLHSFEAVFSPRTADGTPRLAWDRHTGVVHAEVTREWQKYDIRLILESRWQELAPRLRGKLHVFTGDADTFLLEGAVQRLQTTLKKLGSDAVVEVHPGYTHFNFPTSEMLRRFRREMAETFLRYHGIKERPGMK